MFGKILWDNLPTIDADFDRMPESIKIIYEQAGAMVYNAILESCKEDVVIAHKGGESCIIKANPLILARSLTVNPGKEIVQLISPGLEIKTYTSPWEGSLEELCVSLLNNSSTKN